MKTSNENLQKAICSNCETCSFYCDSIHNLGCTQDNSSKEECEEMGDYLSLQEQAEIDERSKNIRYNHETSTQYTV